MADFAALRGADAARFARSKGRHVVVEHEALVRFFAEAVDDLFVLLRAERRDDKRLGFAAGEEGGAVRARQQPLADFDGANRAGVAAVDAGLAVENLRAHELGFEFKENAVHFVHVRGLGAGDFGVGGKLCLDGFVNFAKFVIAGLLRADRIGLLEAGVGDFDDAGDERFIAGGRLPIPGGLAGFGDEVVDRFNRDLHFAMAEHDGVEHRLFGQHVGFGFNHENGAFRAGDDEVEARVLEFFRRGIENELVVDVAHAAGADRAAEGDAGDGERRRGADHRGDVRIDHRIGRENVNDDLHFIEEAVREKRADRAVDEAARERFLFGGAAFALEEPARNLARGVRLFNVVDREREEVLARLRFLLGDDRGENDRIVHAADAGARGLTGNFARFKRDVVVAELKGLRDFVEHRHVLLNSKSWVMPQIPRSDPEASASALEAGFLREARLRPGNEFLRHAAVKAFSVQETESALIATRRIRAALPLAVG